MFSITPYYNPYRTRFFEFSSVIITYVNTEDSRILDLNNFAGISIEQSNLMAILRQPLPESVFPLVKHVISSYTNSKDANNAYCSLYAAIQEGKRF